VFSNILAICLLCYQPRASFKVQSSRYIIMVSKYRWDAFRNPALGLRYPGIILSLFNIRWTTKIKWYPGALGWCFRTQSKWGKLIDQSGQRKYNIGGGLAYIPIILLYIICSRRINREVDIFCLNLGSLSLS